MQVSGMKNSKLGFSDKSEYTLGTSSLTNSSFQDSFSAIRTIVKAEGLFGLYRGIVPNLLKVAPSIGTSFATYEVCCLEVITQDAEIN